MTSKNLFSNLMKENLKRRIWVIAFIMIAFFFALPVSSAISMEQYRYFALQDMQVPYLQRILGFENVFLYLLTGISAAVCAIQGFGWLFSKKKVDLYHSIPVKREKLFLSVYLNGILIYVVPYLINLFISFLVLGVYHAANNELILNALFAMAVHLIYYLLLYSTLLLGVMLTGNYIVSLLAGGVFLFYGPLLYVLIQGCYSTFFHSYYSIGSENIESMLSPLFAYVSTADSYQFDIFNGVIVSGRTVLMLFGTILIAALLCVISIILYKKRPSEAAGRSIVFARTKPVIKICLLVPMILGFGLFFRSFSYAHNDAWLLFGLLIGLVLSQCIIEIIFQFDIKAVFSNKRQLVIGGLLAFFIVCVFRFDLLSYDSYLPEKERVERIAVSFNSLNDDSYFDVEQDGSITYYSREDYSFKNMKLTDFDKVYPLLEAGIESSEKRKNESKRVRIYHEDAGAPIYFTVQYRLKNGKSVYRNYSVDLNEQEDNLNAVYQDMEFKKEAFHIFKMADEELLASPITWYQNNIDSTGEHNDSTYDSLQLSNEEKKELFDTYKEEFASDSIRERATTAEVGSIQIPKSLKDVGSGTFDNYVYPSYKKTIALIEEYRARYQKDS